MIDNATKELIKTHLVSYCTNAGSDNRAANSMGISNAYVSHVKNDKWEAISDDMWRKFAAALNLKLDEQWRHADTIPFKVYSELFQDAQQHANVYGITSHPGSGKTYTLDYYRRSNPNVFHAKCNHHTSNSELLSQLLKSMGRGAGSRHVNYMLTDITGVVARSESPLIIVDELEKVRNATLFMFIDMYNLLEHKCGIVMMGTPNFRHRIERGVSNGKMCYNEFFSRIGGRFIDVPAPSKKDAVAVMRANGITDGETLNTITNDSDTVDKRIIDLRRVERLVHKAKISASPQPSPVERELKKEAER